MIKASSLLRSLQEAGFELKAEGENIRVRGPLTDELLGTLRKRKIELLEALRAGGDITDGDPAAKNVQASPERPHLRPNGKPFAPMGHLLVRSPEGGWFCVRPGIWQHYTRPPTAEELEAERDWLDEQERRRREAH